MGRLFRTLQLIAAITFVSAGLLLVVFSLPFMGWKTLAVQSGSMEPAIATGALVLVKETPAASLKKGDVVTYRSLAQPNTTITHRLIDTKKPSDGPVQYIVKGDANKAADKPVYGDQMVGRVALDIPFMGSVLSAMRTPIGLIALIYIPAALIAIGEIRLLIKRLTDLEIEKRKKAEAAGNVPPLAQPQLATVPAAAGESGKSPEQASVRRSRRRIDGLSMFALVTVGLCMVGGTQAQLTATATLTGSTISAANATPTAPDHVVIKRVDFPGAPTDKVSFQPLIYLYNPIKGSIIDMEGWTLESKSGQVFGFRGATPIFPKTQFDVHPGPSGKLLIDGDYLLLKNEVGVVIDAISWGSDTSQLSPSIQGVVTQKHIKRTNPLTDANTAAEWIVRPNE